MMRAPLSSAFVAVLVLHCAGSDDRPADPARDASSDPGSRSDAGVRDAGPGLDATVSDGAVLEPDAGRLDAGTADAGPPAGICGPTTLEPFEAVGTLGVGRESHVVVVLEDRLLALGGWDGTGARADAETANIAAPGTWSPSDVRLPAPREHHGVFVSDAAVCIVGGDDGTTVSAAVLCASRGAGGTVADDWAEAPALPGARSAHETVQVGRHVFVIGGVDRIGGEGVDTVYRATDDGSGRPGAWSEAERFPTSVQFAAAATDGRHLYVAGGLRGRRPSPAIHAATVDTSGQLGAWREVEEMPDFRVGAAAVVFFEHLWILGGLGLDGQVATVFAWPLGSGELGPVVRAADLPDVRFGQVVLPVQEGLLSVGGWGDTRVPPTSAVWSARCSGE